MPHDSCSNRTPAGRWVIPHFTAALRRLRRLLLECSTAVIDYPCPGCRAVHRHGAINTFCAECLAKIPFFTGARCPGCGGALTGALALCPQCLAMKPRPWHNALALFAMRDAGQELIYRYKFGRETVLARALALIAAPLLEPWRNDLDIIVPIPLHWSRRLYRSFNQAELLGQVLAEQLQIPQRNLLRRTRRTRRQATLSQAARWNNLRGVFALRDAEAVRGKRILLLDDVLTTGATLDAATRALLAAGAAEVRIFVLARR